MSATADSVDPPRCWNCGKPLEELLLPVSRHEYCSHCAEAVHCCRSCALFAPTRPEQCSEDRAEPPSDKTVANFCDFFSLRSTAAAASGGADADARARLEALFAGADDTPPPAGGPDGADSRHPDRADHDTRERRARSRLDDLFGGEAESD